MVRRGHARSALTLATLVLGLVPGGSAVFGGRARPIVREAIAHDLSPPLRDLARLDTPAQAHAEIPIGGDPAPAPGSGSEALQPPGPAVTTMPAPLISFEGVANASQGNRVAPPDPTGEAGPNHFVQMVNLLYAIYDKNGTLLVGPARSNTIWSGAGFPCANTNDGDPIVQYDHLADRWVLSQLSLGVLRLGPFYECVAVSQTLDPTGPYHRYAFLISLTTLNDYPKLGVWPDAYYMSANGFGLINTTQQAVAFERDTMLAGLPSRTVIFEDPSLFRMLPSDLDGPRPPAGEPNVFATVRDDPDELELYAFHVDWADPGSSTFDQLAHVPVAGFDGHMCGARTCIPQPDTTQRIDALAPRLMYRLQYRNRGTHQALVAVHTVDVDGSDHAGLRWYELRTADGSWGMYQQGTFAPDAHHRWMASVAMDGAGNLALGYSISSATLYPGIRYTGRLATDPLGTLPLGEQALVAGGGSQLGTARWGDYSHLSIDPTDGCSFWYTQEYYAESSSLGWRTRIGSFRFPSC